MTFLLVKCHCTCRCIAPEVFWWLLQKGVKVGWVGIKLVFNFNQNLNHKFKTEPLVTLFFWLKLKHYWLSSSEVNLNKTKLLFSSSTALQLPSRLSAKQKEEQNPAKQSSDSMKETCFCSTERSFYFYAWLAADNYFLYQSNHNKVLIWGKIKGNIG